MFDAINNGLGFIIRVVKMFIDWLWNVPSSQFKILFVLGIGISILLFAIKSIRGSIWGS